MPNYTRNDMSDSLGLSLEATKVEYRNLGRSGLKVSVPILGAASFGNSKWADWVLEEDKVHQIYSELQHAWPPIRANMLQALPLLEAAYERGLNTV